MNSDDQDGFTEEGPKKNAGPVETLGLSKRWASTRSFVKSPAAGCPSSDATAEDDATETMEAQ